MAERRRARNRPLAYLLASLSAVGPFCIDAYLPSMKELGQVFHLPLEVVQQTLTAYVASFAFMTLWHGAISDAIGRRRAVLSSFGLFTAASLGCALSTSFGMLLTFRAMQGMTAGAGMVIGRAIVRDLESGAEAQRMLSLMTIVFAIAPSIAPIIGGWLQHYYGWRAIFFFMVAFSAAVWAWCYFALPETLPPEKRQSFHPTYLATSYRRVLGSAPFLAASMALALGFTGFFVYILSAPVYLTHHLHLGETEFVWLFAPLTVGMIIGAWISGRLAGVLTPLRTVFLGSSIMGLSTVINLALNLLVPPGVPWSVLPLGLYSLGMALVMPSLLLLALDLFPAQRGLAASCASFVQSLANSVNAAVIAPLLWATPMRLALGSAGLFLVSVAAIALHVATRPQAVEAKPLAA